MGRILQRLTAFVNSFFKLILKKPNDLVGRNDATDE
tara:strand:+ start:333 stop:440 length:108 start_codon:yes stop_codon:yes gene_type:complete